MPDIVCLHSLKNKEAIGVSETVMKDIQVSVFNFLSLSAYFVKSKHRNSGLHLQMPKLSSNLVLPLFKTFGSLLVMLDGALVSSVESWIESHGTCAQLILRLYSKN